MQHGDSQQPQEERQSIWSVTQTEQAVYFGLFSTFAAAGMLFLLSCEIFAEEPSGYLQLIRFFITHAGAVGIGAATTALAAMEAQKFAMVLGRYLEEKYFIPKRNKLHRKLIEEGRQKGLQEGRQEGRQEGHQEGRQEQDTLWQEWLERREQAREAGEPFDEPPPNQH